MKHKTVGRKNNPINFVVLGSWIALCEVVGVMGSVFTIPQISGWYATLLKPSFSPPNWVFGPVWTTLYLLMGVAAYRIWAFGMQKLAVRKAIGVFVVQLALNFFWSFLFFSQHNMFGGFLDISLLWLLIVYMVVRFEKIDRTASYLMLPYLYWVSFAMVLNFTIWFLNA